MVRAIKRRDFLQLQADGETAETLQSALDALDKLKATSPGWEASIRANRDELLEELRTIEGRLL